MRHLVFLCLLCGLTRPGSAQHFLLSDSAHISLLTADPGADLYATYGHSALRVRDPQLGLDQCYNYGTFDFDQPNFYLNFCRGRLLYCLNVEPYRYLARGYARERRNLREQVLRLDSTERQHLFELLQTNALPENRNYRYDFFYDNCATRIRDIVPKAMHGGLTYDTASLPNTLTMRQLLWPHMTKMPWTKFGMELILGQPSDHRAWALQYLYLPKYLYDVFGATRRADGAPLVLHERNIPEVPFVPEPVQQNPLSQPGTVMLFIAGAGALALLNRRAARWFDVFFWLVLGLAGLIMAVLWFGTEHHSTSTNWNLLWAWPTHLLVFWRSNRDGWIRRYFMAAGAVAALTLLGWWLIPQELPFAALPIIALVALKGWWYGRNGGQGAVVNIA
jgi:Domain of unknown function (DUF4105)